MSSVRAAAFPTRLKSGDNATDGNVERESTILKDESIKISLSQDHIDLLRVVSPVNKL